MKQQVSNKITMYNFFMTLGIVIYHFWLDFNHTSNHPTKIILILFYRLCNNSVGALAMGVFFLMSGFLLYNGANSAKDIFKKIKSRVFSLLIPFIIWNSFMMMYLMINMGTHPFSSLGDFIVGFTLNPFNGPLWYLLALMCLMLFAPVIINLKQHKNISLLTLVGIIIFSTVVVSRGSDWAWYQAITNKVWYISNIFTYLPLYAIGAFTGMHYSDKILNEEYNVNLLKSISIIIFIASMVLMSMYVNSLLIVISAISFWFCIDSKHFDKNPSKVFRISFFIYVMHSPFLIDITYKIIEFLCGGSVTYLLPIETIIYRILGMLLIWGLALIFEFILSFVLGNKIYGLLSGNRTRKR